MHEAATDGRRAFAQAVGAYSLWGLMPLYIRAVGAAPPLELVAHRVLWSLALLGVLVTWLKRGAALRAALAPGTLVALAASSVLIAVNWLVYVWAVSRGHVLEASLGYYLNPLLSVVLGVAVLRERLRRGQVLATLIAAGGVAVLAAGSAEFWVSVTLALSFGLYGLLRKLTPAAALEGLAVETAVLAPVAAGYLLWLGGAGSTAFGSSPWLSVGLALSGAVTVAPLFLFNAAARGLRYSTLGIVQFLGPTIQFVLAATLFGEAVTRAHALAFGAIWLACAIYAADALRSARAVNPRPFPPPPE